MIEILLICILKQGVIDLNVHLAINGFKVYNISTPLILNFVMKKANEKITKSAPNASNGAHLCAREIEREV